jgi:hypothetical protein
MITVTLQQIKNAKPCPDGWKRALKANGGKDADMNKPFPLASILDSNDLDDTLWVIEEVSELAEHDKAWREFACWCAMQNIEKIKPYCSVDECDLIVKYLTTQDERLQAAARSAAKLAASRATDWVAVHVVRAVRFAVEHDAKANWLASQAARSAQSATHHTARGSAKYDWRNVFSAKAAQITKLRELLTGGTKCNYL